mmetsp:Transcript_274/g.605  ORF Transcript_274/g.605 Transcript_274/m.605 type:complete len:107 (-) Transcript_274:616-936(-)
MKKISPNITMLHIRDENDPSKEFSIRRSLEKKLISFTMRRALVIFKMRMTRMKVRLVEPDDSVALVQIQSYIASITKKKSNIFHCISLLQKKCQRCTHIFATSSKT